VRVSGVDTPRLSCSLPQIASRRVFAFAFAVASLDLAA
jgi:hypothetical protein